MDHAVSGYHVYQATYIAESIYRGCSARRNVAALTILMMYAVLVIRDDVIVGHLPHNISTPCHIFLRSGGTSFSCTWSETLFSRFRTGWT